MFAEVTREYDPNKGLKVLIWPSQILTTSADLAPIVDLAQNDPSQPFSGLNYPVPPAGFLATEEPGYTGPQILRMRYADSDNDGQRREPVEGWIQESGDTGELMLSATLDLYLDAPSLVDRGLTVQKGESGSVYFGSDKKITITKLKTTSPAEKAGLFSFIAHQREGLSRGDAGLFPAAPGT